MINIAEFCKHCFLTQLNPNENEDNLVMTEDLDLCEGCGNITNVVLYVKDGDKK